MGPRSTGTNSTRQSGQPSTFTLRLLNQVSLGSKPNPKKIDRRRVLEHLRLLLALWMRRKVVKKGMLGRLAALSLLLPRFLHQLQLSTTMSTTL